MRVFQGSLSGKTRRALKGGSPVQHKRTQWFFVSVLGQTLTSDTFLLLCLTLQGLCTDIMALVLWFMACVPLSLHPYALPSALLVWLCCPILICLFWLNPILFYYYFLDICLLRRDRRVDLEWEWQWEGAGENKGREI